MLVNLILTNPNVTPGIDSITYDTYDPLVLQTRMIIESEMKENDDGLRDFLGLTNNVSCIWIQICCCKSILDF